MRSLVSRLLGSRSQVKFVLRLGLMIAVGIAGVVVLSLLSRAMADVTRSDETAAIFNVAADLEEDLVEAVNWLPDVDGLPRELPTIAREEITETWLRAWSQPLILSNGSGPVGSSLDGDAIDGVTIYFDNSGQEAMLDGADGWLGLPVHQIGHDLRLNFYSDDGSVAGITAESTRVLRAMPVDGGIEWFDAVESFEAVLVLRDGNWRVHHLVRTDASGDWIAAPGPIPLSFNYNDVRSITWRASEQSPAEYWTTPDLEALNGDIETIIGLGFNAIRIELPFEEFGGREVTEEALVALESTLDAADEAGLNVTLSLLGGRTEHQPAHWDADDDQITAVARAVGNHPALMLWELAHAPDLDIGTERTDATMLNAWLIHISRTLRLADPDTPITIGWADARAAAEAPPIADVVSFLYPGSAAALTDGIAEIQDVFGAAPIMIADAAGTTHLSLFPGGMTESEQARYFADLLQATSSADLVGFNVSSLRDFDVDTVATRAQDEVEAEADAKAAEREALAERFPAPPTPEPNEAGPVEVPAPILAEITWPVGAEAANGLIRIDGTPKPAAQVFLPGADLAAVPAVGLVEKVTKPFNMVLLALLILPLAGWFVLIVWDKRGLRLPTFGSAKASGSTAASKRISNREGFAMTAKKDDRAAADADPIQTEVGASELPPPSVANSTVGDDVTSQPKKRKARFLRWANSPVNDPRVASDADAQVSEGNEPRAADSDTMPAPLVAPPLATPAFGAPTGPPQPVVAPPVAGLPQPISTAAAVYSGEVATLTILEVDLEAIDRVAVSSPIRGDYATFLIRAFCIATKEFVPSLQPDVTVEVIRHDAGTNHVIARANDMRLQALARTLSEPAEAVDAPITARLELSTGQTSGITMSAGNGTVPTVCLVRVGERPVTTTDSFGLPAIAVHSVGLLSVSAGVTPTHADEFLARLREIIETRDWAAETD